MRKPKRTDQGEILDPRKVWNRLQHDPDYYTKVIMVGFTKTTGIDFSLAPGAVLGTGSGSNNTANQHYYPFRRYLWKQGKHMTINTNYSSNKSKKGNNNEQMQDPRPCT